MKKTVPTSIPHDAPAQLHVLERHIRESRWALGPFNLGGEGEELCFMQACRVESIAGTMGKQKPD